MRVRNSSVSRKFVDWAGCLGMTTGDGGMLILCTHAGPRIALRPVTKPVSKKPVAKAPAKPSKSAPPKRERKYCMQPTCVPEGRLADVARLCNLCKFLSCEKCMPKFPGVCNHCMTTRVECPPLKRK